MRRRIASSAIALPLVLAMLTLAACGGSEASPSPSTAAEPTGTAPAATEPAPPAATTAPTEAPESTPTAGSVKMLARCGGVALRTGPTMDDEILVRVAKLTKVRVVETVAGDAYEASGCGTSGSDWVKIDRVNGKSVNKLYDVPFVYGAAGFFE